SPVEIEITADLGLEVSTDGGATFGSVRGLRFVRSDPQFVWFRTVENDVVEPSPHSLNLRHRIVTPTAVEYANGLVPDVEVRVLDDDVLLLSEVCANPVAGDE